MDGGITKLGLLVESSRGTRTVQIMEMSVPAMCALDYFFFFDCQEDFKSLISVCCQVCLQLFVSSGCIFLLLLGISISHLLAESLGESTKMPINKVHLRENLCMHNLVNNSFMVAGWNLKCMLKKRVPTESISTIEAFRVSCTNFKWEIIMISMPY